MADVSARLSPSNDNGFERAELSSSSVLCLKADSNDRPSDF